MGKPRRSKVKNLFKVRELVNSTGRLQTKSSSSHCAKQTLEPEVGFWQTGWLFGYNVYKNPLSLLGFSRGLLLSQSSSNEFNISIICGLPRTEISIWFHIPIDRNETGFLSQDKAKVIRYFTDLRNRCLLVNSLLLSPKTIWGLRSEGRKNKPNTLFSVNLSPALVPLPKISFSRLQPCFPNGSLGPTMAHGLQIASPVCTHSGCCCPRGPDVLLPSSQLRRTWARFCHWHLLFTSPDWLCLTAGSHYSYD